MNTLDWAGRSHPPPRTLVDLPATEAIREEIASIIWHDDVYGFLTTPDIRNKFWFLSLRQPFRGRFPAYVRYLMWNTATHSWIAQSIRDVSLACRQRIFAIESLVRAWQNLRSQPENRGKNIDQLFNSPQCRWIVAIFEYTPYLDELAVSILKPIYVNPTSEILNIWRQRHDHDNTWIEEQRALLKEKVLHMTGTFRRLVEENHIDPCLYILNDSKAPKKAYRVHPFLDDNFICSMMDNYIQANPLPLNIPPLS